MALQPIPEDITGVVPAPTNGAPVIAMSHNGERYFQLFLNHAEVAIRIAKNMRSVIGVCSILGVPYDLQRTVELGKLFISEVPGDIGIYIHEKDFSKVAQAYSRSQYY